ncbi:uncharacterized protein rab44 isoform X2 [Thalassophryne amazonica]|uniref:uncharacterized protein rab44 isoform X2 n=1 Tax=Thalassophryne amazonica TaxID=390379 RepID=UPI001470B944|nr:uncharacterized protein rab44 isoform X2 [Thalassophryne amazonica]
MSTQSVKKKRIASRRRVKNQEEEAVDYEFHAADSPSVLREENTEILAEVVHNTDSQSASQHLPSPVMGNRRKLGSSRRSKGRRYVEGLVSESWNDQEENALGNEFLNTPSAPTMVTMRQEELSQMSEGELTSVTHHSSLYPSTSFDFSSEIQDTNKTNTPQSIQNLKEHFDEKDCKQTCCEITHEKMNTSEALWSDNGNRIPQSVHSYCVSSITSLKERPCSQTEQQSGDQSHVVDDEKLVKSVLVPKHQADAKLMSGNVQDHYLVPEVQVTSEDKVSCITSMDSTKQNAGEAAEIQSIEQAPFAKSEQATMNEKQSEVAADHQPEDNVNEMHELEIVSTQMQELHQTQSCGLVMHGANDTSDFGHLLETGKNMDTHESEFNVNNSTADGELPVPKQLNEHLIDESNVDILTLRNKDHVCDSEGLRINSPELVEAEARGVDDVKCSCEQLVHGKMEALVSGVEGSECSFQILQLETNVSLNSQPMDDSESTELQTDTDFKPAGEVSSTEEHSQNSADTCDENTVFQNTTGNNIVAAEITSSSDKDQFLKSTEDISVEENLGIQMKDPENLSQLEEYEPFTTELMHVQEDSPSQNLSNHSEAVISITSVVDELYQGASSPVALDQDMDMKQGDDVETAEDATIENWTENLVKDPVSLVDSVSGGDEVGEKCDVPVREDSAVTEIDGTQESIDVVLFSAPFHEENEKVLAEPPGDACEENGISNAADWDNIQQDTQQQMHFIDDDMHTSTKQKRRKMGSTRRINLNRGQDEGMDTRDVTKTEHYAEAKETNESFSGAEKRKTLELKCNENNLHQVLDEQDVGSIVTDMTHTLTQLTVKENDHYTDIKVTKQTNLDEAVAREEVSESTTWESAFTVMDNKKTIITEEKTSPDSTPSQISQKDAEEADQVLNEEIFAQSVNKRGIGSRHGVPKQNEQGNTHDEFRAADAPSLFKGYEQEENTEMMVEVVHTNDSQSVSQHSPSQEASGNRRKLGSSRRSKERKYVKDYVVESQSEPHEEPVENTSGHDILNTPAVVATVGQEELQESSLTALIEHPCSQTEQHLSDQSHVMETPGDVSMEETMRLPVKEPNSLSQLVAYETFTVGLMQSPEDSTFQNMTNHGEEVISIISIVDELYQEACSPDAFDQNMDMKRGGDTETAYGATVGNMAANYDKDSLSLVDSVSGQRGGEKCDVLAKEEINATQENINVVFSAAESDLSVQFHEENSKVFTEPTGDVCEENGISSSADGFKSQQDGVEETHFEYKDNLDTNTKQKRRKMGSSRRMKLHREQEGEVDSREATKDSDFHVEVEQKKNESSGGEMEKTVESKSNVNNLQQVKESEIMSEVAHNTNTSQDSNASSRRRKLGSTRKNFGSRTKVENLHRKQEMVAETATSERDAITENIFVDKEMLQYQMQHDVCGPEREMLKTFQSVECSLMLLACQSVEEIAVSHIQLGEMERCQPPNDFSSRSPDSSAQDFQSESTSGGRKRKMGSHRKTCGHQLSENRSACEDKITGDRNGRPVESTRDAAAIQTSKDESEESLKKTQVNENGRRPSRNCGSESGANFPSEKSPEHVTVQQARAEVHLVPKKENRHSLGNTKGIDVTPQCYSIVMVGNSGVGKTSFMKRAQSGAFSSDVCASVGIDSCTVTVNVNGKAVVLRLWDTAGQERFHSLTRQMLHRAQAFLLMYDVTLADSFSAVRYWVTCIQEGAAENVTILLLGNKSDCAEHRVNSQEGEILAKEYNFEFMECSAATGYNVTHALETLARILNQKIELKEEGMALHKKPQQRRALGCC